MYDDQVNSQVYIMWLISFCDYKFVILICFLMFSSNHDRLQICRSPVLKSLDW